MNRHGGWRKLWGIAAGLALLPLAGCGLLPELAAEEAGLPSAAKVEIHLASALPEDISVAWDPALVTVDSVEAALSGGGEGPGSTVVVTIQLRTEDGPGQ